MILPRVYIMDETALYSDGVKQESLFLIGWSRKGDRGCVASNDVTAFSMWPHLSSIMFRSCGDSECTVVPTRAYTFISNKTYACFGECLESGCLVLLGSG